MSPPLLLGGTMKTAEVMPGECQGCHKTQYNFRLVLWGGLLTEPNWCIEETLSSVPAVGPSLRQHQLPAVWLSPHMILALDL